jgi:hypothetical protein
MEHSGRVVRDQQIMFLLAAAAVAAAITVAEVEHLLKITVKDGLLVVAVVPPILEVSLVDQQPKELEQVTDKQPSIGI